MHACRRSCHASLLYALTSENKITMQVVIHTAGQPMHDNYGYIIGVSVYV